MTNSSLSVYVNDATQIVLATRYSEQIKELQISNAMRLTFM